ncbi:MAG: CGNR zinc finger domain-containing protein [Pseudonocardiaceae bacterium]
MNFDHYGGEAAKLAADLVNASRSFTAEGLELILRAHGVIHALLSDEQAEQLQGWVDEIGPCFGPQEIEAQCSKINILLAAAASRPQISLHDGVPHLHYGAPMAGQLAHLRAITIAGMAYVVCFGGPGRLGRCARPACGRAFVDTSHTGRRSYCTARCGNNAAVARHRSRQ